MRTFISFLLFFVGFILAASAAWCVRKFGEVTYEQIIFHLNMPFGSETRMIASWLKNTVMTGIYISVGLYFLVFFKINKIAYLSKARNFLYTHRLFISVVWFVGCMIFIFFKMNVPLMLTMQQYKSETSTFYEEHYVFPQKAEIVPPENKQNLILIFAESMESTFAKTTEHNYFNANLIPNLYALSKEGINFSDSEDLGGAQEVDGTQWTQAGLLSQTCGIPIELPIKDSNFFHPKGDFFPKAYCLFDILKADGYNLSFVIGTNKQFAGIDRFVKTHGDIRMIDTEYFADKYGFSRGLENTKKLEDEKLFDEAENLLTEIAAKKQPFAFTMMTIDMHYGTAVFDNNVCKRQYSDGYSHPEHFKDVVSCADKQLGDFIAWIKQQNFYKNTTVVIVGDHLTMNNYIFNKDMKRRIFNLFLNTKANTDKTKNRAFTSFDIYPTIVEAIGYKIRGDKLALGTSLFSGIPTLTEEGISPANMSIEVKKQSKIYDELLFGKQVRK